MSNTTHHPSLHPFLSVCLLLATLMAVGQCQDSLGPRSREQEVHASMVSQMSKIQQQLAEVTNSTQQMLAEIERAVLDCLGMNSELCETLEREVQLVDIDGLESPWSPGKRKRSSVPESFKAKRVYNELRRKRAMTQHLEKLMRGARDMVTKEKKRSCDVNLGFHCQTSEIMDFMEWYNYVNSGRSPGKKRSVPSDGVAAYRTVQP